jgi:hypothetical protein
MPTEHLFIKHFLTTHSDERGNLTVLDKIDQLVNWTVKRSYWITDALAARGGHCVKGERKLYIMAQGSCKVRIFDGRKWYDLTLQGPGEALELKADLWREMDDFSPNSVMFSLCNLYYDKSQYIFDINEYTKHAKSMVI